MTGSGPSGRVNIMTTAETTTTEPRATETRGSSRKSDASDLLQSMEALLRSLAAELAATRADLAAARVQMADMGTDIRDLCDVVQAALPASLIQLSTASLERLMADAPTTRLRLLAPFNTGMGTFQIGGEFLANDDRIRSHGRRMQLGLAPEHSDVPGKAVSKLVQREADRIANLTREGERKRLEAAAAAARTEADKLEAAAKAS